MKSDTTTESKGQVTALVSGDLFDLPISLSPKLEWMKSNAVRTHLSEDSEEEDPWCAWMPENDAVFPADCDSPGLNTGTPDNPDLCGYGKTATDAVENLALIYGVVNWSNTNDLPRPV